MKMKQIMRRLLVAMLVCVMVATSVSVIPVSAEETAVPEVKKETLFSADFENTSSSYVDDGWTLTSAWRYGASWSPTQWYEYPDYVSKTSYDNRNVLQFSSDYYVYHRAIKTLSIADMEQLIVEFDVISPNSKTVNFGVINAAPKVVSGRYYDGVGQTAALWSGAPTEWTRVKVEFTVQDGSVTTAAYEKAVSASDTDYELVSAYQSVSIAQSYIVDELINLSFYSGFDGSSACYFDNVDVYTLITVVPDQAIVYEPETLFATGFENTSSSYVDDGWTLTSAWRYGASWSPTQWYEYPDYVSKTSYDNRNVLQFSSNYYVYHRAIKTLSIADMEQMIVEFDVISPNNKTVSFGLIDAAPKVVSGRYYDGVGQTVALWSGAPTEWTRVKVEFTVQDGSVTTAAYEKAVGASDTDYELVSAYQSVSVAQSYIVDELINLSFYSEFDGSAACYFDNIEVYTTHAYKNGKCIDCGHYRDGVAALGGYSLTLDEGTIGLNFHMEMNVEADCSKSEMRFDANGVTSVVSYSDAKEKVGDGVTYKVFTCNLPAKAMADEITAVMYNDGVAGTTYTYSVKEYADKILADETTYAKEIPLVQAMLNYGTYAQEYFAYNTENPANGGTYLGDTALSTVTADTLATYTGNTAVGNDSVELTSASLVLDAKTTLRLYLSVAEGVTVEGLKTSKYGSYVEKADILPQDLTKDVTVNVSYSDGQTVAITYNCMSYCYNVLKSNTASDALKNVVCALCLYSQSATAYAGQ